MKHRPYTKFILSLIVLCFGLFMGLSARAQVKNDQTYLDQIYKQNTIGINNPISLLRIKRITANLYTVLQKPIQGVLHVPQDCIEPVSGMIINEDTTLCPGTYTMTDTGAFIRIMSENVTLDCNGATLVGLYDGTNEQDNYTGISILKSNDTVKNCVLQHFTQALYLIKFQSDMTNNVHVFDNTIENTYRGFYTTDYVDGFQLYNNSFTNIDNIGLFIDGLVTHSLIENNTFTGVGWNGILLEFNYHSTNRAYDYPHDNTIKNNTLSDAYRSIVLTNGAYENTFENNIITNAEQNSLLFYHKALASDELAHNNYFIGNHFQGAQSANINFLTENTSGSAEYNTFRNNHITDSTTYGLYLPIHNNSNTFVRNSFINNAIQAFDSGTDNQFYENNQGNHWSDFNESAEGCDDADDNGICDAPYTDITGSAGSIDEYPTLGRLTVEPLNPITVDEGDWVILHINATDDEGDQLAYSIDHPGFNSMQSCWPASTNILGWKTDSYSSGIYDLTISVSDGTYLTTTPVTVTIHNTCQLNKQGQMVCSNIPADIMCY